MMSCCSSSTSSNNADRVVIFLDVDGVILPFGGDDDNNTADSPLRSSCSSLFPDSCLAALSLILSAFGNQQEEEVVVVVDVVLSSTWRVQAKYIDQIVESLHLYGKKYGGPLATIDFSDITDPSLHSHRQAEIDAWLQTNDYNSSDGYYNGRGRRRKAWIALDDEELVSGNENEWRSHVFRDHVIKTDSRVGLTKQDAHHAIELLKRQLQG